MRIDMWWLGLALFLLCTIERGNLRNPDNESWFNIFSLSTSLSSIGGCTD